MLHQLLMRCDFAWKELIYKVGELYDQMHTKFSDAIMFVSQNSVEKMVN